MTLNLTMLVANHDRDSASVWPEMVRGKDYKKSPNIGGFNKNFNTSDFTLDKYVQYRNLAQIRTRTFRTNFSHMAYIVSSNLDPILRLPIYNATDCLARFQSKNYLSPM
jgi:hypothetical protein